MNHDEFVSGQRKRMMEAARAVIDGRLNPIEGCRLILRAADSIDDTTTPGVATIRAFESDTEDFVFGESRRRLTPEYLSRLDAEMENYLQKNHEEITEACRSIVNGIL
jgi:hypothetical protein